MAMSAARTEGSRSRQPGDRLARKLELVRHLGEGGMGTVWVARNLATEAEVAIKVLRSHRDDDEHAADRFRHEARLGARLEHRNITRVFDLLEDDDGSLVLVMELLQGQTLEAAYKAKGALSTREAVEIIVPILGALQHAHEHGVVHRDVKPSNVFLHVDPDGHTTPKLLDFGIAKTHDASVLTRTGDALGSPSYMSPEQVRASKKLDGRSDLFSTGVVLYEILTGENPFQASSPTAVLAQVLELEIDPDPRIDPRVWLEIQRALSKQAYERHPSASNLAEALSRAAGLVHVTSLRREKVAARVEGPASDARPLPLRDHESHEAHEAHEARDVDDGNGPAAGDDEPAVSVRRARARRLLLLAGAALVLVIAALLVLRSRAGESGSHQAATQTASAPTASAPTVTTPEGTAPSSSAVTSAVTSAPSVEPPPRRDPAALRQNAPIGSHVASPRHPVVAASAPRTSPPKAAPPPSAPPASVARTPGF